MKKSFKLLEINMKKIVFTFISAFIALGWMGCENKYSGPNWNMYLEIDSALTACGMDSFLIKSPWFQEDLNYIIDSVTTNFHTIGPCVLICDHFKDSTNNDYFTFRGSANSNPAALYDCEGNFVKLFDSVYAILDAGYRGIKGHVVVLDISVKRW